MSKYLVTGGLGVIGSRFAEKVLDAGHEVVIIDAMAFPRNAWMKDKLLTKYGPERLLIRPERIESMDGLDSIIESSDFILHAAAHTGIPHSSTDPIDDWVSNVEASRRILEILRVRNLKMPTVMLSSVKPYKIDNIPIIEHGNRTIWPDGFSDIGIDETCPLDPDEPYAASKMAQSGIATAYARTYDLPVTVLRCSNLYGDAPCYGPRHGWLTWFCIAAALDIEIEIQGTGRQTRDMLFSDDVATAVLSSFENINKVRREVFNIGGGPHNQISCLEAIIFLEFHMRKKLKIKDGPGRKNEDMLFVTNFEKFSNQTGWFPAVGVTTGMERIVNWAQENSGDLVKIYGL
jgi:CDP-paratose 2-epimerase